VLSLIFVIAVLVFGIAYMTYGRFLERRFEVEPNRPTPSHTDYDGVDRVPAHPLVLLGHHFSSIAGAGPIVGPIIAAAAFGIGPTLLWIVLGSILIGGVHDFSALMASLRHRARSIAEIAREYLSPFAYRILLLFIWLALIYVLTVFADLTADTFVRDPGVASSAVLFILLALAFGFCRYRLQVPVAVATLLFVPLVFLYVWVGQQFPLEVTRPAAWVGLEPKRLWALLLLGYCYVASVTPVWMLLQPRDYLCAFLLYASVLGGFLGLLFGGFSMVAPAFAGWSDPKLGSLFPILFITVACGACSGFHALVASGTSSKQLDRESDARLVGYGAMLIEGLVAVLALATVAILAPGDPLRSAQPLQIYSQGMGRFLAVLGLPPTLGAAFGLLALSTFILTTLDTATRLSRYVFEEFFNLHGRAARYCSTLATLIPPTVFVLITLRDPQGKPIPAWQAIWPVFGATNQLLAGLALVVIAVWLRRTGKRTGFLLLPVAFMVGMTVWALILLLRRYRFSVIGLIAVVLLGLAVVVAVEAVRALLRGRTSQPRSA